MIRAVCFLGKQELSFRGHDESENSPNKGNCIEFLNVLAESNVELSKHLTNSKVFSGLSSDVQNDLIASVEQFMSIKIKEHISNSKFVSVNLDEITDIITKSQLSIMLRYVSKDGNVKETFLEFKDISSDCTTNALA